MDYGHCWLPPNRHPHSCRRNPRKRAPVVQVVGDSARLAAARELDRLLSPHLESEAGARKRISQVDCEWFNTRPPTGKAAARSITDARTRQDAQTVREGETVE